MGQAIRSLLTVDDPESEFLQIELKDLHGQLKSLDESIRQTETRPATEADLKAVTSALQRLDTMGSKNSVEPKTLRNTCRNV